VSKKYQTEAQRRLTHQKSVSAPRDTTRRLADLSDRELAPLFNMTIPEARRYRQSPKVEPFEDEMLDKARIERERYTEWLWNLPVEEFKKLRESNDPNVAEPFVPSVPVDVAGRFRALQDLLQNQPEFETRYPAAFEILFPHAARRRERAGLYLPSFEVRILNNWIHPHIREQSLGANADAHTSVSRWWHKDWRLHEVNQQVNPLQYDDLQGVLLAILSREENGERVEVFGHRYLSGDVEGVPAPEESPIRLTDLRLVELVPPEVLKHGLKPVLDLLHRPFSTEHVVLWKLRILGSELESGLTQTEAAAKYLARVPAGEIPEDVSEYAKEILQRYEGEDRFEYFGTLTNAVRTKSALLVQQFGDERTGIAAVSFAAAALWLFLDLDMPGVDRTSSYRLAEQVESLASMIRKLVQRLRRSTEDLGKLMANRPSGSRSKLPGNNHLALQQYRMGRRDLRQTAEWLGITPYSSRTGKGTREWKARVKQRLREGKEFEDENYPRAAAIFANKDHPYVRHKARRAYRGYVIEMGRYGRCRFSLLGYYARTNAAETKRGKEIAFAYLQLGSCIIQRIPLLP
jgi:hypothetical protein